MPAAAAPVERPPTAPPTAAPLPAAPPPSPAKPTLSAAEIAALRTRGDALLATGDIVSARLFYERAAEGGDAQAALMAGQTFDPGFLARAGVRGVRGDKAQASEWYRRAGALGSAEADRRLKTLGK
jgi:TPR repeat protein